MGRAGAKWETTIIHQEWTGAQLPPTRLPQDRGSSPDSPPISTHPRLSALARISSLVLYELPDSGAALFTLPLTMQISHATCDDARTARCYSDMAPSGHTRVTLHKPHGRLDVTPATSPCLGRESVAYCTAHDYWGFAGRGEAGNVALFVISQLISCSESSGTLPTCRVQILAAAAYLMQKKHDSASQIPLEA
jgi:hypothetical protein